MNRTRVKFCGMTCADEIALAVEAGADAVGVILTESPRRVPLERAASLAAAIPPFVERIAVVCEPAREDAELLRAHGFRLQFSGGEAPDACERASAGRPYVKVFHLAREGGEAAAAAVCAPFEEHPNALWQFDTKSEARAGGSGQTFAWDVVAPLARRRPVVISGGLTPDNVAACVRALRPYAVDVRGGVESDGMKDREKMRAFVRAVRAADAQA